MEDDDDYPIINMPEEVEKEEVEEEVEEAEPEPEEFFKKPEMSLKEKRLENLRKAREAKKKKKESKPKPQPKSEPKPQPEPIQQKQNLDLDYDKLINSIVDKLEDNKAKRKAIKKKVAINIEPAQMQEPNIYDSLF